MILLVNLAFSSGLDLNGKSKHWAIEINNLRTKRRSKFERWDTTDILYKFRGGAERITSQTG